MTSSKGPGTRSGAWMVGALAPHGASRRYRRGEVVFREGDDDQTVLAIRAGRVRVTVATPSGGEVVLTIVGPGQLLGELAAIDRQPRAATAVALDDVEAVRVDADAFQRALESAPRLSATLLRALARQLRESGRVRAEREADDLETRVACTLARLGLRAAAFGADPVAIELTQDDLAALVGTTREEVNRALGRLRSTGLVATARGRVEVLDLEALTRRCDRSA